MILPQYKALFIHIPKVAGQSVENFFLEQLNKNREEHGADFLLKPNTDPKVPVKRLAHLSTQEYKDFNFMSEEDFNAFYKFSFVRNPWSRMVSFYKFQGYSSIISFNKFIEIYLPSCLEKDYWFFRPQSDFIYDDNDNLLVDFVGNIETLNADFSEVAKKLQIDFSKLPQSNHSIENGLFSKKSFNLFTEYPSLLTKISKPSKINKDYRQVYSAESKAIIEKYYQRDLDLLKYVY